MGNCCSGGDESKKPQAFSTPQDSEGFQQPDLSAPNINTLQPSDVLLLDSTTNNNGALQQQDSNTVQQQQAIGEAQRKAMREEQSRLDLIVQMAGRGMVSVRSTRGSTGYYDQGFAAALGQHLEQTTKFPDQLPIRLPSSNNANSSSSVLQRLSQPQWENIALGKKGTGVAGCDGENPNTYMDHVAVSFLDSVVPKKERIFQGGVGPMVENLL